MTPANIQQATCTTCRWYSYITTAGVHICGGVCAGEITEQEVAKGCDCWTPRQEASP